MDCVTCEKCRLWGKLQILGLGTAIKVLLSSEEDLHRKNFLSRQEIIALINTLHQFAKSIEFASSALDMEFEYKITRMTGTAQFYGIAASLGAMIVAAVYRKNRSISLTSSSS